MEKDQSAVGIGTVSFDICEMPWNREHFKRQRQFMLQTVEGALNGLGQDTLDYKPDREIVDGKLREWMAFLERMTPDDIQTEAVREWLDASDAADPMHNGYPKCPKHGIYLSLYGCMACNDTYQ